jgi:two-component system sensor histidine kinase RegB
MRRKFAGPGLPAAAAALIRAMRKNNALRVADGSDRRRTIMPFSPAHPNQINFGWLIRLRWSMITGQLVAILGVRMGLGLTLPLTPLLTIIGLEVALNLFAAINGRRREAREWWLAGIMAFDIVMCTGLLYLTGGPSNPFSFLYLVQIALAAITLRAGWTWTLTGLALVGSAVLFLWHRPLPANLSHAAYMNMHLRGMWVAFGVAAGFIVYFLLRVRRALEAREAELAASRRAAARQERLASLATLAAGAAHELSTPLATIAVVMKELERHATRVATTAAASDDETLKDIRLVREQVDRCRDILERMSSEAGTSVGETFVAAPVRAVVSTALVGLSSRVAVRTEIASAAESRSLRLPTRAFSQALHGIIKNAQDASPDGGEVILRVTAGSDAVEFEVCDKGPGIPSHIIDRIGEPFFTTKTTGHGMGLGVFLARAVVEQLGGHVQLDSAVGVGTIAVLQLPVSLMEGAPVST